LNSGNAEFSYLGYTDMQCVSKFCKADYAEAKFAKAIEPCGRKMIEFHQQLYICGYA
jgi:hypothetical protein